MSTDTGQTSWGKREGVAAAHDGERRAVTACLLAGSVLLMTLLTASSVQRGAPRAPSALDRACGVERWRIKVGLDPDASRIKQTAVVQATIAHLRALAPPGTLPRSRRVRPVEMTVWSVEAYLVRYKREDDSDIHLVIADDRGRTMIAELPAPACVGPASPFLPAMTGVRKAFTARFHPTATWRRQRRRIQVTGIGFWDYLHGQSGAAPNGIELHPVIRLRWANTSEAGHQANDAAGLEHALTAPLRVDRGLPLLHLGVLRLRRIDESHALHESGRRGEQVPAAPEVLHQPED